jgi:chorismate mutase
MNIAEKIGKYKKDNNITILQVNRWDEFYKNVPITAKL